MRVPALIMMSNGAKLVVVGILVHLGGQTSSLWAQVVQTSLVSGRVFDSSGGVIPEAEVTLRGPFLRDGERHTVADERGRYRFPALLPGTYRVTASSSGFAPSERAGVLVELGEDRVVDLVLAIGSRSEEVTVAGRVAQIDVKASAIPAHLNQSLLDNLPVSRVFDDLINLVPGVTQGVAFGGTQGSNAIYLNGVQTTDPNHQDPLLGPNHNWLEQMEVSALGAGAEYGGFTGAAANAVVRSGSNRFSGLGEYWTTRPGWLSDNSPLEPLEIISLWDTSGQAGGPILEDRLWFFLGVEAGRVEDRPALFSGPGSTKVDRRGFIARLDSALTQDVHVDALYRFGHSDSTGVGLSPVRPIEVSDEVVDANHLWNGRVSWAVDARTLLEARSGGYSSQSLTDPRPPNTRLGPSAFVAGGVTSVSSVFFADRNRSRADATVSLTRYEEVAGQPHDMKAGFEFETTSSTDRVGYNGGRFFSELPRLGVRIASVWGGESDEATSRRVAAYVRDQWTVHDRVTFNLGLRVDVNRAAVPLQGTIFSTTPVSPRAGVAWALTADNATVVRASYGRYHDSILTRQVGDLDTSDQSDRIILAEFSDGQFTEVFRASPEAENTTIDDRIQQSHVDQFVVGIERELFADLSLQAHYVYRHFDQFMGSINTNTDWIPQQVRDPGPDGAFDTDDDADLLTVFRPSNRSVARRFLYTNPDGAFRRYDAIQLIGTKRYSGGWQFQASYTWSRSEATVGNLQRTNAGLKDLSATTGTLEPGAFSSPNGDINLVGEAPWTISELKMSGSYRLPAWGGLNLSGVYRYHSGQRWGRVFATEDGFTVRAEPRGARRLPHIVGLDLRIEKTFDVVGTPGAVGLFVDVFNVTNEGTVTFVRADSGPEFGAPIAWTDPRMVRAGLRYSF